MAGHPQRHCYYVNLGGGPLNLALARTTALWYNAFMVTMTITLPDERLRQLQELAQEVGIAPEELVQANIESWLISQSAGFAQASQYVLEKNNELYRRLA